MNVRSTVLLAAAALMLPLGAVLLSPDGVTARPVAGDRSPVLAQRRGQDLTPEQWQAKMAEREAKIKAELGLSDAQAAQIKAIRESYKPQMDALRTQARALKDSGADRQARQPIREQMKALHDQVKAEIETVLTPEQQAKFAELREQRGHGKGGHGQGRRGGRGQGGVS